MKKALGVIAVLTGAAALVAYKLKKDSEKEDNFQLMDEEDISDRILKSASAQNFSEEKEEKASTETASYPHLSEEDLIRLNELSETHFEEMENQEDVRSERPLQHTVHFEDQINLDKYKGIVINEGYVVTSGESEKDLVVLNITSVTCDAILSKVFYLANLAKEHEGTYVDWVLK